jgi:hypothetical protein
VLSTTESASRNLREMAQSSISEQQKEEFKQKAIESLKEEKEVLTEKEVTTKVEDMVNKKVDETMELYKKRVLVSNDDREIEGLLGEEGKNALSEARKEISREVNTQYAKNIANNEARKDRAYLNANPEASELSQGELRTERQASDIRKKLTVVAKGNLKENNNEEKVIPISSRTNRAVITGMAG